MFALLLLIALVAFYFYATRNHSYWAKRNVNHDRPIPLFGNHFRNAFGARSITELSNELYTKFPNDKVVGYYRGTTPELIVRDLEIAKKILSADFTYFYMRGLGRDIKTEPLLANLFNAEGDMWKLLRQRMTPAFTTAKLKGMFPLVVSCAKKLQVISDTIVQNGGECDIRELMARFTTEFIAACGFGIEVDSINNENSKFRELGKRAFKRNLINLIFVPMWELFPELRTFLNPLDNTVELGITSIVKSICEQRDYKPTGRNDFVDLLLESKNKGIITGASIEHRDSDGNPVQVELEMSFQLIVAQVFIFFVAGFETSSSATSYMLHQLAFHPKIQKNIQKEIDEVLEKHNNELCYDSIAEMSLLSQAFKESMRLFPSLGVLNRECAKQYTIPELDITLDPGVKIIIPMQAIQNDEKYFEDPQEFKPERFADNRERHSYSYLPFGAGPRGCVGARLGEMQSLAGLAALLQKFSVEPSVNTRENIEVQHTQNIVQCVQGGLPLKLTLRVASS